MSGLIILVPVALVLGGLGLLAFLWSIRAGQYEDLDGASRRILLHDAGTDDGGCGAAPTDRPTDRPAGPAARSPSGERRPPA